MERYYDRSRRAAAHGGGHHRPLRPGHQVQRGNKYFDEEADWYQEAALKALRTVAAGREGAEKKPIFEINTGAMARGYRSRPYPADFLLAESRS
ncbi:MAG: hypothetical protein ACLVC5_09085 [Clostridia bacterium]